MRDATYSVTRYLDGRLDITKLYEGPRRVERQTLVVDDPRDMDQIAYAMMALSSSQGPASVLVSDGKRQRIL